MLQNLRLGVYAQIALCACLAACATAGNSTLYEVPCGINDGDLRAMLKDMAKTIAADLNKPQKPTWELDNAEQLKLSIELEKNLMNGPTAIGLSRVTGSGGYQVAIVQLYKGGETPEIQHARVAIEKAISKSACPAFERRIDHSRPHKLG